MGNSRFKELDALSGLYKDAHRDRKIKSLKPQTRLGSGGSRLIGKWLSVSFEASLVTEQVPKQLEPQREILSQKI